MQKTNLLMLSAYFLIVIHFFNVLSEGKEDTIAASLVAAIAAVIIFFSYKLICALLPNRKKRKQHLKISNNISITSGYDHIQISTPEHQKREKCVVPPLLTARILLHVHVRAH